MIFTRRIARRLLPLVAAFAITAGLACVVGQQTPAAAMPAPAYKDVTSFSVEPAAVQKAQWKLQIPGSATSAEAESVTARFLGVGAMALVLAAAFALVLMMFDRMMRGKPAAPGRKS